MMQRILMAVVACFGLLLAGAPMASRAGSITVPSIFSESMVLQHGVPVPVWGWGTDGDAITVSIADGASQAVNPNGHAHVTQKHTVTVAEGKWQVTLEPLKAGGPYTMLIIGKNVSDTLMFTQVLAGEVWVACGQSNMMMGVSEADEAAAAIAERFKYPNIRVAQMGMRDAHQQTGPITRTEGYWGPVKWENATYTIARSNREDIPGCTSAVSYYFAREIYKHFKGEMPIGMIEITALLPAIAWTDDATIAATPELVRYRGNGYPNATSKAHAANIAPLAPYPVRGAIYYQGEMDGGQGQRYRSAMPALIKSWRTTWQNPEMPFFFVQLAGYTDNKAPANAQLDMDATILAQLNKDSAEHGFVGVREAQAMTAEAVPFTGMASALDLGDPYDIHPGRKRQVGERLSLHALKLVYGETDLVASGPAPAKVERQGEGFAVTFKHVGGGLVAKDGALKGFEVSANGTDFLPAQASIAGDTVTVSSPDVKAPVAMRYAWAGFPICDLYNKEGLPATPFRFPVPE